MRELFWPRKGFGRSLRYFRLRVLRLTASPHAVAAGVMAGIVSSWTPFIGFHIVLALAFSYLVAGNMLAAALSTAFANPLTLPFILAATWELGHAISGNGAAATSASLDFARLFETADIGQLWGPILKPMLIGAVPLAAISGIVFYFGTFMAVRGFQARRRTRMAERHRDRLAAVIEDVPSV